MAKPVRAWKLVRSVELALIVGGVGGLITAGLFRNRVVGSMGPLEALWLGIGVGIALAAAFTYVFDQVSQGVGNVKQAADAKRGQRHRRNR